MRSTAWFGQGLAALLLVAAGAILWRAGELEQRIAAAERDLVTLPTRALRPPPPRASAGWR